METASEAFVEALDTLRGPRAWRTSPRGQKTRELLNYQVTILDPRAIINTEGRKWQHVIGVAEAAALVGQISAPEILTERFKNWQPFVEDGVLWGAYGPRIAGDLGKVVRLLKADPDTRQAVLTIYDSSRDLMRDVPDVPCTIAIQFLLRGGQLHMRVMMRSNDIWLGFPYDTMQFAALQDAVARAVGVSVGTYTHTAGSLHLYERDFERASKIKGYASIEFIPMWSPAAADIGEISARARSILLRPERELTNETEYEKWMRTALLQG